jgi:hypothetical protein
MERILASEQTREKLKALMQGEARSRTASGALARDQGQRIRAPSTEGNPRRNRPEFYGSHRPSNGRDGYRSPNVFIQQ